MVRAGFFKSILYFKTYRIFSPSETELVLNYLFSKLLVYLTINGIVYACVCRRFLIQLSSLSLSHSPYLSLPPFLTHKSPPPSVFLHLSTHPHPPRLSIFPLPLLPTRYPLHSPPPLPPTLINSPPIAP